jgi:hypothetical protein
VYATVFDAHNFEFHYFFFKQDQSYNHRVKKVVYLICHPANTMKLPAVEKLMKKNEG